MCSATIYVGFALTPISKADMEEAHPPLHARTLG